MEPDKDHEGTIEICVGQTKDQSPLTAKPRPPIENENAPDSIKGSTLGQVKGGINKQLSVQVQTAGGSGVKETANNGRHSTTYDNDFAPTNIIKSADNNRVSVAMTGGLENKYPEECHNSIEKNTLDSTIDTERE